jgi:hypothetical protein
LVIFYFAQGFDISATLVNVALMDDFWTSPFFFVTFYELISRWVLTILASPASFISNMAQIIFCILGLICVKFYTLWTLSMRNHQAWTTFQIYCFVGAKILITNIMLAHKLADIEMKAFNSSQINSTKGDEIKRFLNRLLPKHIQDQLMNPTTQPGQLYQDVTILFADLVGFTAFSSGKHPS